MFILFLFLLCVVITDGNRPFAVREQQMADQPYYSGRTFSPINYRYAKKSMTERFHELVTTFVGFYVGNICETRGARCVQLHILH